MREETWEARLKGPDGVTQTVTIKAMPKTIDWLRTQLEGHWKKIG